MNPQVEAIIKTWSDRFEQNPDDMAFERCIEGAVTEAWRQGMLSGFLQCQNLIKPLITEHAGGEVAAMLAAYLHDLIEQLKETS